MRKAKPPPVQARMLDILGNLNPQWQRWFQTVGMFFDDFRRAPDIVYSTDVTLTTDDFGKTIVFDTTLANRTCTLMDVTAKDVYCWLTIFRRGLNKLIIVASPSTMIEYSTASGRIWNNEQKRRAANVTLQLISATQWGIIGATGIWRVM